MWEDKPSVTTACVGWGSFSVAAPSQKSLQKSVALLFVRVCLGFLMPAMICYSLSSGILMLLTRQRSEPAVRSRAANIKSAVVRTYFLPMMGLEKKTLFPVWHFQEASWRDSALSYSHTLLQHKFALARYVTVLRTQVFAPKSKRNQWLQGFSLAWNSSLNNHQRIKGYPEVEGTHKEHPSPTHDLKPQNH